MGFLTGYRTMNRNDTEMHITHLLFADDTLVFCRDSSEEMVHLSWLLLRFEAILSLRINLEKSIVLAMEEVENLDELTSDVFAWSYEDMPGLDPSIVQHHLLLVHMLDRLRKN